MLEFIKEYKEVLVSGLAVILTIVCMIIKRKPKTLDDFHFIVCEALNYVSEFCALVERPGNGSSKKREVILAVRALVVKALGRSLSPSEVSYVDKETDKQVELVLRAPTKKEVSC